MKERKHKKPTFNGSNLIQFRRQVREYYKPYYDKNDPAHRIDHADDVCTMALELALKMQFDSRENYQDIILASYIHDMFCFQDRKTHNILAENYVIKFWQHKDIFLRELSGERIYYIAQAVKEHRASYKEKRYHKLSQIISMADRGVPDLETHIKRSMLYNKGSVRSVIEHMHGKFGSAGYCEYPPQYEEMFKVELSKFTVQVDNLTEARVIELNQKGD